MILLSYDGSNDAQAAIERAAQLMPGAQTTVLTVWQPYLESLASRGALGLGMGMAGNFEDADAIDLASERDAKAIAAEGAERATAAGLDATPRTAGRHGGIANTILAEAAEEDADLIVLGTRGLAGVKSFLLGSVSHTVVQHADRPVLIAPSPALSERRREWVAHERRPE
jgi:nucleotide-binding universal stress UspA family protein